MDHERPDPMQTFYLRQGYVTPRLEPDLLEEAAPLPPLAPVSIRWRGLFGLFAFVLLTAGIARGIGIAAAEFFFVAGLLVLAAIAILTRRLDRQQHGAWITGDGGYIDAPFDAGCDVGGGGGDG